MSPRVGIRAVLRQRMYTAIKLNELDAISRPESYDVHRRANPLLDRDAATGYWNDTFYPVDPRRGVSPTTAGCPESTANAGAVRIRRTSATNPRSVMPTTLDAAPNWEARCIQHGSTVSKW